MFAENDPFCSKNQAVINHKSTGYELIETTINGLCRIKVKLGEEVECVKGLTLSFGLSNVCRIVDIFDAGGQTQIEEPDGRVVNIYERNAPPVDICDEDQLVTIQ